jgi:endonuclease/exonuclease/phosphatase family metal-dependent hydrolase
MKKSLLLLLLFLPFILSAQSSLMSFNLRYNNPGDKENSWENRKVEVADMLHRYRPGILGIQEGLHEQVVYLDSALEQYDYTGVGREDGKTKGEYSAIFYHTATYKLLSSKTYWLSETPEKVSVGWDAALERIVTSAIFIHRKTNDTLYVFNCHLDHMGKVAREKSAELMLRLITGMNIAAKKLVVMGDFNAEPHEAPILLFDKQMECLYKKEGVVSKGPAGTFNSFNTEQAVTKRIDYIFTKNLTVSEYHHIDQRRSNQLWLSDHLPVLVKTND